MTTRVELTAITPSDTTPTTREYLTQKTPEAIVVGDEAVAVGDVEEGKAEPVNAVPVAEETRLSEVPEAPIVTQAIVTRIKERPRTFGAGTGCVLVMLALLLVFLLTPRSPSVRLRSLDISDNGDGTYDLVADISFTSRAFIEMDWRNLNFELEWAEFDDVSSVTVTDFRRSGSFSTAAYGSRDFQLGQASVDNSNIRRLAEDCDADGEARLRLRGDARSSGSKLNANTALSLIDC
mmetsp:Transcript_8166/g.25198  ORF Transcript_8166/g.25198 Transcript_8166/m.25198 type:complete len:236 (+) Transcript_8166:92-799(+)